MKHMEVDYAFIFPKAHSEVPYLQVLVNDPDMFERVQEILQAMKQVLCFE